MQIIPYPFSVNFGSHINSQIRAKENKTMPQIAFAFFQPLLLSYEAKTFFKKWSTAFKLLLFIHSLWAFKTFHIPF